MRNPRVALVSSYDPDCGIGVYTWMLATALKKEGVETEVITRTKDNPDPNWGIEVHKVVDVKNSQWPKMLANFVRAKGYDVVHVQHEYALWTEYENEARRDLWNKDLIRFLEVSPVPVIVTAHSVYTVQGEHQNWFMREASERAANTIVHAYVQRAALANNLGLTEGEVERRFEVIPHWSREGIELDKEECKKEFGLEGIIVGHPTFIQPNKGTLELVEDIWPRVYERTSKKGLEVKLFITGKYRDPAHEEYYAQVQRAIATSPIRETIMFREDIHPRNGEGIRRAMSASDLLAWPHTEESTSGSVQMGIECGVPCVASAIEGMTEQVGGISRNGITVPPVGVLVNPKNYERFPVTLDYSAFSDAIYHLITHPEERIKFSKNAGQNVREWSGLSVVAKRHLEVYKAAVPAYVRA